jgi:hypothetical protein
MKPLIIDEIFKLKFKQICLKSREELIGELSSVFLLSEFHFSKAVLNRYYKKYPAIVFDKKIADKILINFFGNGGLFVTDFNQLFGGGYERLLLIKPLNDDELIRDPEIIKEINNNWYGFVAKIKSMFWHDNLNYERILSVGDFCFFKNRAPESLRESNMLFNQKNEPDALLKKGEFHFFNISDIFEYYDKLIRMFYPGYTFMSNVSNKKIRRYGKHIDNDIYLIIYVDFSFLERELKLGYLELPHIKVELLSNQLNFCIQENSYLSNQSKYPIVRIDLNYFMGSPIDYRIGNSSDSENSLKKDLFFYAEVYSFYLQKYLKFIEKKLRECI